VGLTCYWVSSLKMTFLVEVDHGGIVRNAAPIAHRFIGQTLESLLGWMNKQGGLQVVQMQQVRR